MGIRITPDNNDIVVWKLDESAAPFVNSSTSPSAPPSSDLTVLSGDVQLRQPSPFAATGADTCVRFTATNSGSPRNFISGANNFEPQAPLTVSWWMYLRSYNNSGSVQHVVNKQRIINTWSGGNFGVITMQNTSTGSSTYGLFIRTTSGTDPTFICPLNMWCHVGFTWDGTTQNIYLNGTLVGSGTRTGALDYSTTNKGPWFIGAIPSGSGNPEETAVAISDIRIANVVRDLAYFRDIYNSGGTSSGFGVPLTIYNKLRAYDLSCNPPTPVYWVSTTLDYTNAPLAPCGSLGPIELVETWPILGFEGGGPGTIQDALSGLMWLLPNTGNISSVVCSTLPTTEVNAILPGDVSTTYNVQLRFRGVVEQKTYLGGTNDGAFYQTGGSPAVDNYNVYALIISNPPQTYYLNRGTSGLTTVNAIDYTKTIPMNGGATVTLLAQSIDNQEIKNQDGSGSNPFSVPGITNPAQPYDGQFIQMGVISVT